MRQKKGDSRVIVIVQRPMVQLGKPMGTTSLNWSSKTPNPHTPQALLVYELPEITITVLVRTRTWDIVKSQQLPTSCTTSFLSISLKMIRVYFTVEILFPKSSSL